MDSGLVYKGKIIDTTERLIYAYEDPKVFKLFALDIGMLGNIPGHQPHALF